MKTKALTNKDEGNIFEQRFLKQARSNGLWAKKNELCCKFIYGGHLRVVKSNLDYFLADQLGRVAYLDCKSYGGDFFTYSDIDKDQLDRAVEFNNWNIPAGFVIWFRVLNRISLFTGLKISANGPRSRFEPMDGLFLGSFEEFDLKGILSVKFKPGLY